MDRFRDGDEEQRVALMQDRSGQGTDIPLNFYQSALASDPSPRVRMATFEAYVDAISLRDPQGVKPALQALAGGSDPVLSRVARQRLDSLDPTESAGENETPSEAQPSSAE